MDDPPLVHLRDLRKSFHEGEETRVVLDGVNARIERGAFVVVAGRSGSGKSTLLNLISGIERPDSGEVVVEGTNLTALPEKERTLFRRRHVGFVFQSFNLIPTLTVEENVTLPLALGGRLGAAGHARGHQILARVGLEDRAGSFPDRLSGGEQQRVALARALAHDPLLILADEPTGNLDLDTGRQVLDLLTGLVRAMNKTLLVATHDRALLDRADRVLRLQGGRLRERRGERMSG